MRIKNIHHQTVKIASPIRNAVIDFSEMTASVVAIETDVVREGKPVIGYGFNSNGRYGQAGILQERIIPRLLRAQESDLIDDAGANFDPFKAWDIMMKNEKPGGHGERSVAVGVIDMALWDLVSKIEEKPLYKLLAERFNSGSSEDRVYVYAAGGYYYPGKDLRQLQDEFRAYLDLGYDSVKMKIGGADLKEDMKRIEAALEVAGEGSRLAVDANGRFDLKQSLEYGEALAPLGLKWYEEACDPLDYLTLRQLCENYPHTIATGENLFSYWDALNLMRYGGMRPDRDIIQVDPALSYGLVEYLRILRMFESFGFPCARCIPHGGHQFSLHIAAGLGIGGNESYPGVFEPFGGFADGTPVEDGYVGMPEVPGIGMELKAELMKLLGAMVPYV